MPWSGTPSGAVSLFYDGSNYFMSRHIGAQFYHVVEFDQLNLSTPWNIKRQYLYVGDDACGSPSKTENLSQETNISQHEYAYQFDGEDVGSLAHGNETLESLTVEIDGVVTSMQQNTCYRGQSVELNQVITANVAGVDVAKTTMSQKMVAGGLDVDYSTEWLSSGQVGYYYSAMMPVNNSATPHLFLGNDYYDADTIDDEWSAARTVFVGKSRGTACDCTVGVTMRLRTTAESVDSYSAATQRFASWQIDRAVQGVVQDWSKLYFERVATNSPVTVNVGEIWTGDSRYFVSVFQPAIKNYNC